MVDRLVNTESNARRIACVEQCFGASGQPLKVPGRVLVGEGVLTKLCRKKPKPRQFFLFNDILVYGSILISKKKYTQQHVIPLEYVKLEDVEDEPDIAYSDTALRNGWKIISPKKSFVVYAATNTEKQQWMSHINKCVSDLLLKRGITQTSDNDSPVWVPDSDSGICMHCKKSRFSLMNRRHHCRKCGMLVCNACSTQKWLLPSQSSRALRVCQTCYDELASAKSARVPVADTAVGDTSEEDSSDEDDEETGQSVPLPETNFQAYD